MFVRSFFILSLLTLNGFACAADSWVGQWVMPKKEVGKVAIGDMVGGQQVSYDLKFPMVMVLSDEKNVSVL
jgi:hypothetical protein